MKKLVLLAPLMLVTQWVGFPGTSPVRGQTTEVPLYQDESNADDGEADVDYSFTGPAFVSRQMTLLRDARILEKLKLDKAQRADLREIEYEWRAQLIALVKKYSAEEHQEQRLAELEKHYGSLAKEINEVLGEENAKHLRKLTILNPGNSKPKSRFPLINLIVSPSVAKELRLAEPEQGQMELEAAKLSAEIDLVVARMEMEASEKLFDLLKESQKQKLEAWFGSLKDLAGSESAQDR